MTTTTKPFDPIAFKEQTRQAWQAVAKAYGTWGPTLHRWLGPATERMLDMAHIEAGQTVLDVAAGAGEQTVATARRVGVAGRVVATDIASAVLDQTVEAARRAGLSNVETRTVDAEQLDYDATFDAAIARLGLSLFPEPERALVRVRRSLRRRGHIGVMVLSTAEANGFLAVPLAALRDHAGPSSTLHPGPFDLGAPGALADVLRNAGFVDIETKTVSAPLQMESASECTRFAKEAFGTLRRVIRALDPPSREAAWREVEERLREFELDRGFIAPCEVVLGAGTVS